MKFFTRTILITCLLSGWSLFATCQDSSFHTLFQKAFNCIECPDSLQISLYSAAIEYGTSDTMDLANFHNALVNRARIASRNDDRNLAIKDFTLALNMRPDDYYVRQLLGTVYLENGQFRQTIEQLSWYIRKEEDEKKASKMIYVGETYDMRQMRQQAIQKLNDRLAPAYNNRALAKAYSGDHAAACLDFRKAFEYGMTSLKDFLDKECRN